MSKLQEAVDQVVQEAGRHDAAFADGVEAALLFALMQEGNPVVAEDDEQMILLRSSNREVYRSYAECCNYSFVAMKDVTPLFDKWRFMKRQ